MNTYLIWGNKNTTYSYLMNKAQVLIDQFGYYQFLNLVDFMQKNPGAVSFGLNLINRK